MIQSFPNHMLVQYMRVIVVEIFFPFTCRLRMIDSSVVVMTV